MILKSEFIKYFYNLNQFSSYNTIINNLSALENLLKKFSVKQTAFILKTDPLNPGFNLFTEFDFLLLFNTQLRGEVKSKYL